jgi:hypothetical protein
MNSDERQLITDLFQRMRDYGAPEKDRDAEILINQQLRANPDAAYMLVQSVLVQEQGLEAANGRIQELEEQLRSVEAPRGQRSGGFLDGFWGGRRSEEPRSSVPQVGSRATPSAYDSRGDGRSPWGQSAPPPQAQPAPAASGGGFMRSALTTAAGVAGGLLVADGLRNMLGGGAHASQSHREAGGSGGDSQDARYVDERDNDPGTQNADYEDDGNDPGFDSGGSDELDI